MLILRSVMLQKTLNTQINIKRTTQIALQRTISAMHANLQYGSQTFGNGHKNMCDWVGNSLPIGKLCGCLVYWNS